jgi:group I intron endonuclease
MIVYLLLNRKNNKAYIGQHHGHTLSKRWNKQLNNVKVNSHLSHAIEKYGPTSFTRKILCHASCQEELDLLEQFWIAAYHSTNPKYGYNKQSGGRKWRGHYTKELRELIGEATRKAWAKKTKKEKWEFSFATKLRWLMRSERQRRRITAPMVNSPRRYHRPWNKGMKGKAVGAGRPSGKKGRTFGPQKNPCRTRKPFTKQHKERISTGLKKYFSQRRSEKGGGH